MGLRLTWVPREQNEEADALTNAHYSSFTPGRRVNVNLEEQAWIVLPRMLKASEEILARVRAEQVVALASGAAAGPPRKARRRPLRESDPW